MSDSVEASQNVRRECDRLERNYNEIATLAGGLAHEIRNPLSTISLNLDLLVEDLNSLPDPAVQRMLRKVGTIQKECEHLDEILEAFLLFSRAGELSLESCHVADLIRNFLEFYQAEAKQHHIDVRPHLAADLPVLKLDSRLIRQALSNLMRNAQQAMPEGGLIEIQTFRRGDQAIIEIIDNGCGMSAAAVSKLFTVFYSTKATGNGLGLPTVRKIVETHGGTILCESEPDRGTKFTLSFPIPAVENS